MWAGRLSIISRISHILKVVKFHSVTSLRPFQIQKAMYYLGSLVIDDNGNITDT